MRRGGLGVVLALLLLATLGPSAGEAQGVTQAARTPRFACHGLEHQQVRGQRPTYTRKKLADFRNHKRMCTALWLPEPRKAFVPQGITLGSRWAWVSGYLYRRGYGERACRLVQVDLRTGTRLSYRGIVGRVGTRPTTYCRHGGGVLQRGRWLWVVEKNRLWLVQPSATRSSLLHARRAWRLAAPVRGSSLVLGPRGLGLVPFQTSGRPAIHWFSLRRVLRPGVLDLAVRSAGRRQVGAAASTRIPTDVQGATTDASGRLYLTRSNLVCGELVIPGGRRIGFVPGAEGIQFSAGGARLWTASESGAVPYAGSRKPLTPGVASFEWPGLLRGRPSTCRF